ncbi:hypothetical protein VTO73DRAFT_1936 [Trametes versicolor]
MTAPITVHAIERGRAPSNLPRSIRILETAHFDVVITPTVPLHIGQHIQINSLDEAPNPAGRRGGTRSQPWYTSTPADIAGRIVGIRTMELAVTEFIVFNEENCSLVEHAYLSIQHIQGVTVMLDPWRRMARTILLPFLPHTRHVPIEKNAVVIMED